MGKMANTIVGMVIFALIGAAVAVYMTRAGEGGNNTTDSDDFSETK